MYNMLWYRCFKQRLIKQEKEIYIFLYSTVRCSNILKSKHDCIKTIYEKYCTKPQSIAKIVLKNGMSKEFLFLFQKKNLTDMKKRSWFYDFTYKCTSNIAWFTFWFWGVTNACGDTTKCTSVTFLCGNANVTRYYII